MRVDINRPRVWSLGWEDPLEEGPATHSGILARIGDGQTSLAGYSPRDRKESDTTEQLGIYTRVFFGTDTGTDTPNHGP